MRQAESGVESCPKRARRRDAGRVRDSTAIMSDERDHSVYSALTDETGTGKKAQIHPTNDVRPDDAPVRRKDFDSPDVHPGSTPHPETGTQDWLDPDVYFAELGERERPGPDDIDITLDELSARPPLENGSTETLSAVPDADETADPASSPLPAAAPVQDAADQTTEPPARDIHSGSETDEFSSIDSADLTPVAMPPEEGAASPGGEPHSDAPTSDQTTPDAADKNSAPDHAPTDIPQTGGDTAIGTAASELLSGTVEEDSLLGHAGDDTVNGSGENDIIRYTVGQGSDSVDGGEGVDHIIIDGMDGRSSGFLIEDADTFNGRTGANTAPGTIFISADGVLIMTATNVEKITVNAGSAGDTLTVHGDFSTTALAKDGLTYNGEAGADTVNLSGVSSGHGVTVTGGGTADDIAGGVGDDTLAESGEVDRFGRTHGDDTVEGPGSGNSAVHSGNDTDHDVTPIPDRSETATDTRDGSTASEDMTISGPTDITPTGDAVAIIDCDGNTGSEAVTLSVDTLMDEGPTDITLTRGNVDDDDASARTIAAAPATADADTNADVAIEDEVDSNHDDAVQVTDAGECTYSDAVMPSVTNLMDERPTDITLTGDRFDENSDDGTVVATLPAMDEDEDAGETFTDALASDISDRIESAGDEVRVEACADIDDEAGASDDVAVQVTDPGGHPCSDSEDVDVTDRETGETPADIAFDATKATPSSDGQPVPDVDSSGHALTPPCGPPLQPETSFTIEMRVNFDTAPGAGWNCDLVAQNDGYDQNGFYLSVQDGKLTYAQWDSRSMQGSIQSEAGLITPGEDQMVSLVIDNGMATIYLDGRSVASGSVPSPMAATRSGCRFLENFDGQSSEIRIWNSARSQAQVQSTLDSDLNGSAPGLHARYAFGEGDGSTVTTSVCGTRLCFADGAATWKTADDLSAGTVAASSDCVCERAELENTCTGWTLESGPGFQFRSSACHGAGATEGSCHPDTDEAPGTVSFEQIVPGLADGATYEPSFDAARNDSYDAQLLVYRGGQPVGTIEPDLNIMTTHTADVTDEAGDDVLAGGNDADTLDGGYDGAAAGDSYTSIENIIGNDDDDRIHDEDSGPTAHPGSGGDLFDNARLDAEDHVGGDAGHDVAWSGRGNDTLSGRTDDEPLDDEGGSDLFVFRTGDEGNPIDGGSGWMDTRWLEHSDGDEMPEGWTVGFDKGSTYSSRAD